MNHIWNNLDFIELYLGKLIIFIIYWLKNIWNIKNYWMLIKLLMSFTNLYNINNNLYNSLEIKIKYKPSNMQV